MVVRARRDPARIEPLLENIKNLWQLCPDLRFGQLLENVILTDIDGPLTSSSKMHQAVEQALWNWEEARWEKAILSMRQKISANKGDSNEAL